MTDRLLYRVAEAADVVGVSRAQCYVLISRGVVPHIMLGDSIRVPRKALEDLIERRLAEAAGRPWPLGEVVIAAPVPTTKPANKPTGGAHGDRGRKLKVAATADPTGSDRV